MKKSLAVLLLSACITSSAAELTIGSYNTHHGEGNDRIINLAWIAETVKQLGADIVSLQETDMNNGRSYFSDQPRAIAYLLCEPNGVIWKAINIPAIDFKEGKYGNAILYRTDKVKLNNFKIIELPGAADSDGKRAAGIAYFSVNGIKQPIQFISTHFTHRNKALPEGGSIQTQTYQDILKALKPDIPTFIAADFNATSDESRNPETFRTIKADNWRIDSETTGQSVPEEPKIIDYIISKNAADFQVKDKAIIHNTLTEAASDHFPIKVTYTVE